MVGRIWRSFESLPSITGSVELFFRLIALFFTSTICGLGHFASSEENGSTDRKLSFECGTSIENS